MRTLSKDHIHCMYLRIFLFKIEQQNEIQISIKTMRIFVKPLKCSLQKISFYKML